MDKTVTAAEANREFSSILRAIREGVAYVVTSHGQPVARIAPLNANDQARDAARRSLLLRLASTPAIDIGPWTRDELYD